MVRGICFTYATMFALESLAIAGETYANSTAVRRACDFLVEKQKDDGGWGETYLVRHVGGDVIIGCCTPSGEESLKHS